MGSLTVVLSDKEAPASALTHTPAVISGAKTFRRRRASGMKSFLLLIFPYFELTAIVTHISTVIIAFQHGGFWMGLASLILAGPAEIYWIFKLFDDQPAYAAVALVHLLLIIPLRQARKGIPH